MPYDSVPSRGVPAQPANSVQFNDAGIFGGDVDFTWDKNLNVLSLLGGTPVAGPSILMQEIAAVPSAPAAARVSVYNFNYAGMDILAYRNPADLPQLLYQFGKRGRYAPNGNNTTVGLISVNDSATGTPTARTVATTNRFLATRRIGHVSAAGAGSSCGTRNNQAQWYRGDVAGNGGFLYVARIGLGLLSGGQNRAFAGLRANTAVMGNVEVSTQVDILGLAADVVDGEWQFMHNDAAGTATKVPLGASFPFPGTANQDFYEVAIYSPPNGGSVFYRITRLDTGDVATGSVAANIPLGTTLLSPQIWMNNGATAAAVAIDTIEWFVGSNY